MAAAGLTVIDMIKGTDPAASIEGIKVRPRPAARPVTGCAE